MSALFRSNSPSKRLNNGTNRTKFPFILMPLTDIEDRRNTNNTNDDCEDSPHVHQPTIQKYHHHRRLSPSTDKAARRNAIVHQELTTRFPPINPEQKYLAHEQIRRQARSLYPSTTGQATLTTDSGYIPNTNPVFKNAPLSDQFQALVLPRISNQRPSTSFRACVQPSEESSPCVVASGSNSTSQVVFCGSGDVTAGSSISRERELEQKLLEKDDEIHQLKQEQVKLKLTLKETALEAQTIKAQQETLRIEFATLENHFETLEEKFENQDEVANIRDLVTQAARLSLLVDRPSSLPTTLDLDRLVAMIQELNVIAGNYQALEIGYTNVGAKFQRPNTISLILYRNGMIVDDGNFRPYSATTTVQFIQDIYDGYFPTELQTKYPDGIAIMVKDERHTLHPGGFVFPGEGKKLSNQVELMPKFYPGKKLKKTEDTSRVGAESSRNLYKTNYSSATSYLHPTTYIHLPDLLPLSNVQEGSTQRTLYKQARPNRVIVLKLRNLKTGTSYKLKTVPSVTPDEIVRHLETQLDSLCPSDDESCRKYQLLNSVPFGVFSLGDTSLRHYGLTGNVLLYFCSI